MKKRDGRVEPLVLAAYVVLFYGVWTGWVLWVRPLIKVSIENEWVSQLIKSGLVKNLVWTLPAVLLVQRFRAEVYIPFPKMFSQTVDWRKYLPVFAVFFLWVLAGSILRYGRWELSGGFGADKLIIVLFVGLTEEMVFRGWLLNAMYREDRKVFSLLTNAVMFLVIHFPVWIDGGIFFSSFASLEFMGLMVLSMIFSWAFLTSGSTLVPIALHMYWDLLAFLFL